MAPRSDYVTGTISLETGSTTFTGTGTGWAAAQFREGDTIIDVTGATEFMGVIASIDGAGTGTLTKAWEGPNITDAPYRMRYQPDGSRTSAQARELIEMLGNGNLAAFAGLEGGIDKIPYFTAPGAMGLLDRSDLTSGLEVDAKVEELADRDAYDLSLEGFAIQVNDIGDGRAAVYFKRSDDDADWSTPGYLTGDTGPAPTIGTITVNSIDYNDPATGSFTETSPGSGEYTGEFNLPRSRGYNPRGAYSGATAYAPDDTVLDNGSTWRAKISTTGNAPPVLPTTSNTQWELVAAKGTDGTGTGDVVGPASSVANRIALFDGTTGKLLKDAGVTIDQIGSKTTFETLAAAIADFTATPPTTAPSYITTFGRVTLGDKGGAVYRNVGASEPKHSGKFSITKADTTVVWYELVGDKVNPQIFASVNIDGFNNTASVADAVEAAAKYLHEAYGGGIIDIAGMYLKPNRTINITTNDIIVQGYQQRTAYIRRGHDAGAIFKFSAGVSQTFTVTIASPAVVTKANHGYNTGDRVQLSTTGALPTGLAVATNYYVNRIDANTFNLSATSGGSNINTTGSQSGVHTVVKNTAQTGSGIRNVGFHDPSTGTNANSQTTGHTGTYANSPYAIIFDNCNHPIYEYCELTNEGLQFLSVVNCEPNHLKWQFTCERTAGRRAWFVGASAIASPEIAYSGGIWGHTVNIECGFLRSSGTIIEACCDWGIYIEYADGFDIAQLHVQGYYQGGVRIRRAATTHPLTNVFFTSPFFDIGRGNGMQIDNVEPAINIGFVDAIASSTGLDTNGVGLSITGKLQRSTFNFKQIEGFLFGVVCSPTAAADVYDVTIYPGLTRRLRSGAISINKGTKVTIRNADIDGINDAGSGVLTGNGIYFGTGAVECAGFGNQVANTTYGYTIDTGATSTRISGGSVEDTGVPMTNAGTSTKVKAVIGTADI